MPSSRAVLVGRDNPLPTSSGVTFESVAAGSYVSAIATSWQHVLTSPVNCLLVAVNANAIYAPSMSIDTGQTFTLLNTFYYSSFANTWFYLYGLINPILGTRTITVSVPSFGGYSCGGSSIAYSGVSGFAANGTGYNGQVTNLTWGLPAFPGGVAVQQITPGWTSLTQTSRQNSGGAGWQESTVNTGNTRNFSTTYGGLTIPGAVGVVLKGQVTPTPTPTFVDTATGPVVTGAGILTSTWNHTIAAGTNCLLVGVFSNDLAYGPTALSIDSGGPFTVLRTIEYASFGEVHYTLYGLLNPPVGTRTLTTTAFAYGIQGVSAAYSGVSSFAATHATTITGTNITFGLPADPGGLAVAFVSSGWSSLTQTSRSNPATGLGWQESRNNTATNATVKGTANAVLGTSVTIPAHAVNDVIVVFAYQNGIAAAPGAPAASGTVPPWSLIQGGGGNSNGSGVWSFTATATNHTSGTWTSCTGLIAVVIQGADPTIPVGGFAQTTANASGVSGAPAITQRVTNGSSCLLYFHGHRSNVTTFGAAPTGFTRQAAAVGSSGICLNTKDDTRADGAATQADDGNGGYVGQTVEILGNPDDARNFSTTWAASAARGAVAVVLK